MGKHKLAFKPKLILIYPHKKLELAQNQIILNILQKPQLQLESTQRRQANK